MRDSRDAGVTAESLLHVLRVTKTGNRQVEGTSLSFPEDDVCRGIAPETAVRSFGVCLCYTLGVATQARDMLSGPSAGSGVVARRVDVPVHRNVFQPDSCLLCDFCLLGGGEV